MLDPSIIREIAISFIGTLIAIFFAGILWLIKSAYERHKAEKLTLARFERMFALDITLLHDNFEFIDKWIKALETGYQFSFSFRRFITNEQETYKLSNLSLIRKILTLNYMLEGTNLDLDNLYKDYWRVVTTIIDSIQDEQQKRDNLEAYHKRVLVELKEFKRNKEPLEKKLIDALASIGVAARIRHHSLFGYLDVVLFRDIFPRMSQKAIKTRIKGIKEQIAEKLSKKSNSLKNPK